MVMGLMLQFMPSPTRSPSLISYRGLAHANWGEFVTNIVRTLTGDRDNSFLESIQPLSEYNSRLTERFKPLLGSYRFLSVCETRPEERILGKAGVASLLTFSPPAEGLSIIDRDCLSGLVYSRPS